MERIKKIDIHAHATPFAALSPRLFYDQNRLISQEELLRIYDDLDIEKGVLLPLVSPESHHELLTSGDVKMMCDQYPDRFLWFCGMDPRMYGNTVNADLSKLLNHYTQYGAKGVGELTANLYADDPMMENLFSHCGACDMPVTIHIAPRIGKGYGIVDELGLPRLEGILKRHGSMK